MATATTTVTKGLLVRIEAQPGRESDVEQFLDGGLPLVVSGKVAAALGENAGTLFAGPQMEQLDVLAAKLPG